MRKYKKDYLAFVRVLAGNAPQPEENVESIMLKLRTCYEQLKNGTTDDDVFDKLAAAINVGLERAALIHPDAHQTMIAGAKAMEHCDELNGSHGRYGFAAIDLRHVNDALDMYEDILRLSTPLMMNIALKTAMKRMAA